MTSHVVFKFEDESVGRVATTKLVKLKNGKSFSPASAKDLPEELASVKWQQSMHEGSFLSDGYYPAEILAIAGKSLCRPQNSTFKTL